ncbi:MAG TPA: menaquinone biosynthesis decarboxylase, partial [Bacteroidetes bacterium]|nr:menaquinone biosynthesis decarboxylase [Bacteroidota bacterium]
MAFEGLNHFVDLLDRKGQLIRIKQYVDPILEIAEVTDRVCKQKGGGKALLFENTGTNFPVLTNAFGSDERISLALGISNPDEAAANIESLFQHFTQPKRSLLSKLKMLPKLKQVSQWLPQLVTGKGA